MIGIFGGTFDPIHFGHLRPVWEVKQSLGLDQVRLIPCHIPPHRATPSVSAEDRAQMVALAIQGFEGLMVDRREILRSTPSYTVETLRSLRAEFPDEPLVFILGLDAFSKLASWREAEALSTLCHFAVMLRPGYPLPKTLPLPTWRESRNLRAEGQAGAVSFIRVTELAISATQCRQLLSAQRDVHFLTPASVCDYIHEKSLYSAPV